MKDTLSKRDAQISAFFTFLESQAKAVIEDYDKTLKGGYSASHQAILRSRVDTYAQVISEFLEIFIGE